MRLAQALAIGMARYPRQIFLEAFDEGYETDSMRFPAGACWAGTIHYGLTGGECQEVLLPPDNHWIQGGRVQCPECFHPQVSSFWTIGIHLNDAHGWRRERITAWAEQFEPVEVACIEPPPPIEEKEEELELVGM